MLLLTTGFVSNGYQKVYAAGDLGTQIREWVNNQITEGLVPPFTLSALKITLTGFPHQTGESVTIVSLASVEMKPCRPFARPPTGPCVGDSNIVIPGIGQGRAKVIVSVITVYDNYSVTVIISGLPGQTADLGFSELVNTVSPTTRTVDIPGIGIGQIKLLLVGT